MTFVKFALLGGVALAASTLNVQASELDDLKAQIEAMNAKLALLEAAPAVPAGYNLLSFAKAPQILAPGELRGKNDVEMPQTMRITPTADVVDGGLPSTAAAQWTGHVKAAFVYEKVELRGNIDDSTHIKSDAELNLKAVNDTAVGEVGVRVRFSASADGHVLEDGGIDRFYGWWKMTPELTIKAGFKDSIGGVGHGLDKCECNYTDVTGVVGGNDDDTAQLELRYGSGPIEAAIALEHEDLDDDIGAIQGYGQLYTIAGEVKWSGDTVSAEVSGYWGQQGADSIDANDGGVGEEDGLRDSALDVWQIGAGLSFGLDAFSVSAAAGYGDVEGVNYWEASLFASASISDSVSAEAGVGYGATDGYEVAGVLGGVYWSPVDKLTLGAEGSWQDNQFYGTESVTADLVSIFKF